MLIKTSVVYSSLVDRTWKDSVNIGATDILSKEYMNAPRHAADALNFLLFDGEQVILAANLRELDPTEIALVYGNDAKEPVQKVRDVVKS